MAPCNTNQTSIGKPRRACLLLLDVANADEATRGDCNCVMAGFVPAIDDFASLQQRWLDARDKLGHEAGPGPVI
jgi:hypothetical protein